MSRTIGLLFPTDKKEEVKEIKTEVKTDNKETVKKAAGKKKDNKGE